MSPRSQRWIDHAIGGAVSLLGALALLVLSGAWAGKESAASHQSDIQKLEAKLQRVLDVVCELKPTAQACKEKAP